MNERMETRNYSDVHAYTTRERNAARGTGTVRATVNLAAIDTCEMRRSATRGPRCFDSDPVYIRSKTPREGGQLTRVARALKRGRNMLRATRSTNAQHRRINFSPILTEIDLTLETNRTRMKKRWRSVKTSYRFTDGLCRKCRHLPQERPQPPCVASNGTCYVPDASFKIILDGMRKKSLLQKLF